MSRPIKFRAWNKLAHKMADVDAILWSVGSYMAHTADGQSGSGNLDDVELLQYTGLLDKHDRPIYEGDIIKADWHWDTPHLFVFPDDFYWINEVSLEGSNLEVIGNIYENGDLLK